MYEVALDEAWELFGEYLDGARSALVCVASGSGSSERSRAALSSAAARSDTDAAHARSPARKNWTTQALFLLVEGLDPLCLIVADDRGRRARPRVPLRGSLGKPGRAFGRSVVAFRRSTSMLDDGAGQADRLGAAQEAAPLRRIATPQSSLPELVPGRCTYKCFT